MSGFAPAAQKQRNDSTWEFVPGFGYDNSQGIDKEVLINPEGNFILSPKRSDEAQVGAERELGLGKNKQVWICEGRNKAGTVTKWRLVEGQPNRNFKTKGDRGEKTKKSTKKSPVEEVKEFR